MSTNKTKSKKTPRARRPHRPRNPTNGKPWPKDRWSAAEEAEDAHVAFLEGAHKLIGRGKPWEWTEAEQLGMRIVTNLGALFHGVPSASSLPALRRAVSALNLDHLAGVDSLDSRRVQCVEYIATHAEHCRTAPWRDEPEQRRTALKSVVHNFAVADKGLAKVFPPFAIGLSDEALEALEARILRCGPGGITPERVLAEIIVLDCHGDALGYGGVVAGVRAADEADEDAIEAVRQRLATITSKIFPSTESA